MTQVNRKNNLLPKEFKDGLNLSMGTDAVHDIDIESGSINDDSQSMVLTLGAGITREIDAAYGTGNGGLFSGASIGANSIIYPFLVNDGGTINVGFDDNVSGSNIPGTVTHKQLIGFLPLNSSSDICAFLMRSHLIQWLKQSERNIISGMAVNSWLSQDITSFIPNGYVKNVLFGGLMTSGGHYLYINGEVDYSTTHLQVIYCINKSGVGDQHLHSWGSESEILWVPITDDNTYRMYATSYTADVKLRGIKMKWA